MRIGLMVTSAGCHGRRTQPELSTRPQPGVTYRHLPPPYQGTITPLSPCCLLPVSPVCSRLPPPCSYLLFPMAPCCQVFMSGDW